LLDDPWIRADLEHVEIVIGFEHETIGREVDFDQLGHIAEVGDDGHFRAVRTKGESDGISRVVRNGKRVDVNVADGEMLARLNGFDAVEPLANVSGSIRCIAPSVGSVTYSALSRDPALRETVAVVGVLVRDEDTVDVIDGSFDGRETRQRFAFPESGVHEERVRSVSSNVMLPELPDAKMETRKPIVRSSTSPCNFASKRIFRMMAERWRGVNGVQLKTTLAGQAGAVEGEAVEGARMVTAISPA